MEYTYLVMDSEFDFRTPATVVQTPQTAIKRLIHYVRYILSKNIDWVEIYDTGLLTFGYALTAWFMRKKISIFLIGMELLPAERGESNITLKRRIKRLGLYFSLKIAHRVIYKELHMCNQLRLWGLHDKSHHLHNAVPVKTCSSKHAKDIDIIYVNSVRKMRYPLIFLEAINLLHKQGLVFSCKMIGFHTLSNDSYIPDAAAEKSAFEFIKNNNLEGCVEVMPFRKDSLEFIERAKVFVLPSDVIYANYSLLEAMSLYSVPVVTNGSGAHEVVAHGIDGFVCDFNSEEICDAIKALLLSPEFFDNMSEAAHEKIYKKFNIQVWAENLFKIYTSR